MSNVKSFPLPDLGEGLTEAEIIRWLVAEGDTVALNQPIVEVETAKASVEIPAKWAGVVTKIFHREGATVEVGTPIIEIDTEPAAGHAARPAAEPAAAPTQTAASSPTMTQIPPVEGGSEPGITGTFGPGGRTPVLVGYGPRNSAPTRRPRLAPAPAGPGRDGAVTSPPSPPGVPSPPIGQASALAAPKARVLAKPPVRKLARDLGVDLRSVRGTGPSGSITREDVRAAAAMMQEPSKVAAPSYGPDREQRIPVRGVRKVTAENMVASAFSAPHATEFLTVDMTASMKAIKRLRALPDWKDVRVSPLLLVAKAALLAIERNPMINSTWSGETGEIVVKEYVNLGIAAATPRGLLVPNIKDAGRLSLRELAEALAELTATARAGRTPPADLTGGTFTITNVGVFGVDTGTPILVPGEAAILAFGAVREMPWVHRGRIRVRQVTTLGLSFDHRIVDGELASLFLRDMGTFLSDPGTTLLAWT